MRTRKLDPASLPPYADSAGAWLIHELIDHLWPWSLHGFQQQKWVLTLGLVLALTMSAVWVLAGLGQVSAGAVIGWWVSWSVFEILIRHIAKSYIKEGPWWRRNYRSASLMDLVCYVSFKNLLIGATLFLGLKSLNWLQM